MAATSLDADVREAFLARGHAVLDDVVPTDELSWLQAVVDDLVVRAMAENRPDFQDLTRPFGADAEGKAAVPQVMSPHHAAPELLDGQFLVHAERIGRACLGPQAVTTLAMVIAKPGHSPGVVPWHQDAAYWRADRRVAGASIWLPLQDVDEDNGCLWFVPGSHTDDVHPHRHLGGDPTVHALELAPEQVDLLTSEAVAVPLRCGQGSIHDGHTLHHSGPNRTSEVRRALVLSVRNPSRDVVRPGPATFPWS